MIRALPHVLARIFGPPLLIAPAKLDQMLIGLHAAMHYRGSVVPETGFNLPDFRGRPMMFDDREDRPSARDRREYRVREGVATINVHGVLVRRAGQIQPDSTILQSYEDVTRVMRAARDDATVRGILLDIDSPGGEAGGVFDLAREIRATSAAKPVWAIANDDAMSAAYLLASSAQRIYATQTAALGSIGVVAVHADQSAFDAAEGLKYTYVYRGAHKIDGNPHEALSEDAHAVIQAEVDRLYGKLVDMVGEHRGLTPKQVRSTEAGVYFGDRARGEKLADKIGTLDEAHAALVSHTQRRGRMDTTEQQPTPAAETPAAPTPPAGIDNNVIQLRVDEARAALRAEAREIAELCALARQPALAAQYIGEGLTRQAVQQKLLEVQAAAAAKAPIVAIDTSERSEVAPADTARQAAARRMAEMYPGRR